MRIPIPNNRLVAFTLAGGLLTVLVATGLAFPGLAPGLADSTGEATEAGVDVTQQIPDGAPEPNQEFAPAVQTQSGYDEHEEDEYEEDEYEEDEYEDDEYEDDEHEEDEYEEDEHEEDEHGDDEHEED
ncbi:hypothetical protein [Natronomonas sp. LN261]|uniref:hypothetical protein n=1 Tax=Natronomonas sp. LN261 TaxID=2750669 RepID=UPI0015EEBA5A|nr:hypothetical protein [Natronomonas sp. LN261]